LNSRLVVLFGKYASGLPADVSLKSVAGHIDEINISNKKFKVIYNLHPASLIYNTENTEIFEATIEKIGGIYRESR
jgi:uracil-DNA glycosylase